jgi:serine protease Do
MAALQEIGREFARIAEEAYPGVVTIVVNRSGSSEEAVREMLRQRGSRSRLDRRDLREGPSEARRSRPTVPEDLVRGLRVQPIRQLSRGLGILVSADGRVITNNHIVSDANSIEVKLADGRSFQGKVVGTDPATDIAVLKIEAEGLRALELGDSDAVVLGDWVIGIGNPMGIGRSFTAGLVTGRDRSGLGMADYENFIQTDAAPALGDGGGPLLDLQGRVVGMNTAVLGSEWGRGIGLAIPINMVKTVYEQLIETGVVGRGFLGIMLQDLDAKTAKALGLEKVTGVVIAKVMEGSAAEEAGLRSGDVIVEFEGKKISSSNQLRHAVAALEPGTRVEVAVIRDGETKRFTVTLGERPSPK